MGNRHLGAGPNRKSSSTALARTTTFYKELGRSTIATKVARVLSATTFAEVNRL